jgi:hypothetical protein
VCAEVYYAWNPSGSTLMPINSTYSHVRRNDSRSGIRMSGITEIAQRLIYKITGY